MFKKLIVILLAILLFSVQSIAQQQDGSVLGRRVTLSQKNQALGTIFDQISWQAGVFFSYDASILPSDRKYSVEAENKSLYTVLNSLFGHDLFVFTELENQIIISKRIPKISISQTKIDTIPVKYFFLTGKIIDAKKGEPVTYASVSLLNKPIGTITNTDGDFLLKLHPDNILDTLIISSMGYSQIIGQAHQFLDEDIIEMTPISIRIREVKVTSINPSQLLHKIRENISKNYSSETKLMSAFYRETVKQDGTFISVSEAVLDVLKAPYNTNFRNDLVRLKKGRRSPDFKPFQWLNFKLQGGPFTITKLDVVKTVESFIHEDYEKLHKYNISKVIWYNENPVYILQFHPISDLVFPSFIGEMYVHRETFAIVHASFRLNKNGLREAQSSMIKKKPRGVSARPSYVQYSVNYQNFMGKWHLATAQASVKFKIRSRRDKVNSEYHSVSDLLITDILPTDLKKIPRSEVFTQKDVFVEMINSYDEKYWENYNIIKPDEDLRNAFKITSVR